MLRTAGWADGEDLAVEGDGDDERVVLEVSGGKGGRSSPTRP